MNKQNQKEGVAMAGEYKQANPKLVGAILALAALVIVGFTAALSIDLQLVRRIDATDYTEPTPEQFMFEVSAAMDGGKIAITGWACVADEQIDAVETDIVLYLPSTGEYYMLPTEMQQNEAANDAIGGEEDHAYAGFYATVWPFQLECDLSDYEVCIAYRTNFKNALIHTGQYLEVAA